MDWGGGCLFFFIFFLTHNFSDKKDGVYSPWCSRKMGRVCGIKKGIADGGFIIRSKG